MMYHFSAHTSDKSVLDEYIKQFPGMAYTDGDPIMGIRSDYVIDTSGMELSTILAWINDQNEYGELECEIMADLCKMHGLNYDEHECADDVFERLCAYASGT